MVTHEAQLRPQDPDRAKEFANLINQMRDNIGVPPTRDNIARFAQSKVL